MSEEGGFEPFAPEEKFPGYAEWEEIGKKNGWFFLHDMQKNYQIQQQQLRQMQQQLLVQQTISLAVDPRLASRPSAVDPRLALRAAPSFAVPSSAAPSFAAPSFAAPSFAAPSSAAPSSAAPSFATPSFAVHGYASGSDVPRSAVSAAPSSTTSSFAVPSFAVPRPAASSSSASGSSAHNSAAPSSYGNAHGLISQGFGGGFSSRQTELPGHKTCLRILDRGQCDFEGCKFSHEILPEFKTRICPAYRNGTCIHKDACRCPFAHGDKDLFCGQWNKSKTCAYGDRCQLIHFGPPNADYNRSGGGTKRARPY
jgi:hypothetical protein